MWKTTSRPSYSSIWTPTSRKPKPGEDGLRRDIFRGGRCAEPRHAVLAVRPVEQRAHDFGRDALASMLRLDAIADLDAPVLVGRRMEPDRADDLAGCRRHRARSPVRATAGSSGPRSGRRCGTPGNARGPRGKSAGTVAPSDVAAPSVSPSRSARMNPSDIDTSSKRGVRIDGTEVMSRIIPPRVTSVTDGNVIHLLSTFSRSFEDPMDSTAPTPNPLPPTHPDPRATPRLEGDPRDGEPARDAPARHGWQVAGHHACRRVPDDDLVGVDRRPAGGRGEPRRRRRPGRLGPVPAGGGRPGPRPRRQQHDQRLLRHDRRRRYRRLRSGALRPASDPVGLGDEAPARHGDPHRQRDRRRDHAVPRRRSAGR